MKSMNVGLLLLVIAVMAGRVSPVMAATVSLPQTGQSKCYDASGNELTCAGTGQDAERQIGVKWTTPRFVVGTGNESQCVTDKLTGLMWSRSGNLPNGIKSWSNAVSYSANLVLCGYSDWRLPDINELESLVNLDVASPATWLNTQGFSSVLSSVYWSATTQATDTTNGWYVVMSDGEVSANGKGLSYYVWPVRSGQ
jgi:hypothetical protein